MSEGFQAIAAEVANYSKRSLEDHTAAMEKLMGAKSSEKAIEVQSEYIKMAYEGFFAQATKIGEELTISLRKNAAKFDSCAPCGRVCSRSG